MSFQGLLATQIVTLLALLQKNFVNIFFVFAWEFCIEKWRGFLVNFFWSPSPTKRSTKSPRTIRGKFGAKFGAKFRTKFEKFGKLSFCNFSDLTDWTECPLDKGDISWRQIWRVAGKESGSPELLGSPRTSPRFPELLQKFPATSPEVLSLCNVTAIQRFPGSFPNFPGSSPNFPGSSGTSPEVSPSLWEA